MITKKQLKKELDSLSEEVKDLSKLVKTKEVERLREAKKLYDEQTKLLGDVRFRVKSAKTVDDERGKRLVIVYQLPIVSVSLDENGEPAEKVPFFYAVNALGLVGISDYEKISKALEEAKKSPKN